MKALENTGLLAEQIMVQIQKKPLPVLDLGSPHKVADRLDDEKGRTSIPTLGGIQQMTIVNEPGLYSVILRSDKPQAKPFFQVDHP